MGDLWWTGEEYVTPIPTPSQCNFLGSYYNITFVTFVATGPLACVPKNMLVPSSLTRS
jgi:hypothetical protein